MATDAEIRAAGLYAVPQQKYLQNPFQLPTEEEEVTESFGIPQTNAFTNSGNNFGSLADSPYTANLTPEGYENFRTSYGTTGYLPGKEPKPSKFQPALDLIGKGIGMAIPGSNFLMGMAGKLDNFKNLSAQDKAFAEMQMAGQEQNIHGGNLSNQDRYGYNKRSMFGNYADTVSKHYSTALKKQERGEKLTNFDKYFLEKGKEQDASNQKTEDNESERLKYYSKKINQANQKGIQLNPGAALHSDLGSGRVTSSVVQDRGGGMTPGTSIVSDQQGLGHNAGNVRAAMAERAANPDSKKGSAQSYNQNLKKGGRAGYFFGGTVKPKRGLVDEPGSYAGKKDERSIGERIIDNGYFMRNEKLAGPDDGSLGIGNIIEMFLRGIELPKKISDEGREDLSSVKEIFQEDSPYTEDAFGSSEGLTLSPLTMIRRYFAEQELKRKKDLANGGRVKFKNGGLASIL
tara:strand:+ start:347 stop:1723 length:1377 start_codon:yes stop_codon:yes gene_type:complete